MSLRRRHYAREYKRARQYRRENRDKIRAIKRAWVARNRDRVNAQQRERYRLHAARRRDSQRARYRANRRLFLARNREYRQRHAERVKLANRIASKKWRTLRPQRRRDSARRYVLRHRDRRLRTQFENRTRGLPADIKAMRWALVLFKQWCRAHSVKWGLSA